MNKNKKVIFIVGPTASGKTELSNALAENFNGSIFNCDSLQVYKSLDIGTAKPTIKERQESPHYLFDYINEGEISTAGSYRRDAMNQLNKVSTDYNIFVGGSGFYIQSLVNGMFEETPIKEEIKNEITKKKETLGIEALFDDLLKVDPQYANLIHKNDQYRIIRALQLVLSLNKTMAQIKLEFANKVSDFEFPLMYLGVNPGREVLKERITLRLQSMVSLGFLAEVQGLLDRGLEAWKPLGSVGYKEAILFLKNELTREEFDFEVVKNTMRLAKRQMTWFKRNQSIYWTQAKHKDEVIEVVKRFFKT